MNAADSAIGPGAPSATRRGCLRALFGAGLVACGIDARAHGRAGPVDPPQPAPALRLLAGSDGAVTELPRLLRSKVTALQLMFTGCSATCPIQGAMFADVQRQLATAAPQLQLLSISIDPLADTPQALRTWMKRFGAQAARWSAAVVVPDDLDRLFDFLRGRASGADRHTPQVYLFDRHARLVYRTLDLPDPTAVAGLLRDVDRLG